MNLVISLRLFVCLLANLHAYRCIIILITDPNSSYMIALASAAGARNINSACARFFNHDKLYICMTMIGIKPPIISYDLSSHTGAPELRPPTIAFWSVCNRRGRVTVDTNIV